MPRKYTVSDAVKKARKKPRLGRKPSTEKWVNVRFPVEFVEKHQKDRGVFRRSVFLLAKRIKRKLQPDGEKIHSERGRHRQVHAQTNKAD